MHNLNKNDIIIYLNSLIGKFYKILPLREEYNDTLSVYIDSLRMEIIGFINMFPNFKFNNNLMGTIFTLQYLMKNDTTKTKCKREVFKCINTTNIIIKKLSKEGDFFG